MKSSNTSPESRNPRWIALLLAIGIAASLLPSAWAIDPDRAMSQYIRERWGTEQGFPRGPIYAMAQSSDGYLWIGARAGLIRFDGFTFSLVRHVPGLSNGDAVLGLISDRSGNLWIRLEGSNLLRYRDGTIDRPIYDTRLDSRITAMNQSNQGELLIALMERGTMVYRDGKFQMIDPSGILPRSPVLAVAQTPDNAIWVGTRGAGLFRSAGGHAVAVTENLPDPKVNCLLPDEKGGLWVGTDEGIVRWDGSRLTSPGPGKPFDRVQVLAMARDRDGNIWAGTDSRGLLRLNDRGAAQFETSGGGTREAVTAVFEDREGNLWFGGANGIERLRDSAFVTYSQPEGLPSDGSKPVFVDAENRMWFPSVNGGLWWMKDGRQGRVTSDGLDRDVVYSIAGAPGSELWIGRQRGGLTRLQTGSAPFTAHTYTTADGLAQDSVFSVYRARDGSVWAGTLSGGVSRLQGDRFTNYTAADGLLSNTVSSILEGSDGTMWFATPAGLSALAQGRWSAYTTKDGLPSDSVYSLVEDSTGVLWIGTAGGIALHTAKGIQKPAGTPASLQEHIFGLEEDRQGSLWAATSNHVLRVNRDKLLHDSLGEGDLREYGMADGLRGVEGVRRHRSVVSDPAGRIWFSLNRGISVVDPGRLTRNAAPAIVHVQSISADGSAIGLQGAVHIPGGRQRIIFGYAGLSLSVPERTRFRYRLDNFDNGWNDSVASREAVYTNLGPGPYRFRVIASNPDGAWNSREAVIDFKVDPLLHQTWWFRTGLVVALAAIAALWYRARMQRLTARMKVRFEERLAERTRIAQELHDTLLQGFLSASMQVHVAADSLPEDAPAKSTLTRATQLMRQVIDEGRNAVRGLRSSSSASLDLEQAFSRVQQELAPSVGAQVRFRVIVDGQQKPLHPLIRDDIYRIGREALINAFRHARAKSIEVELKYSPRQLNVLVRDDGCGIQPQILQSGRDGHWGLSGMRERAEQIGARLRVFSSPEAGTEVQLNLPGHVAFQDYSRKWFFKRNGERDNHERSNQDPRT